MSIVVPTWLLGIQGKLIGGVIILAILGLVVRSWLNAHDDKIAAATRYKAATEFQDIYNKDIKSRMDTIRIEVKASKTDLTPIYQKLDQLSSANVTILGQLRQVKLAAEKRQIVYVEKAGSIPASELDPTLRSVSNDIAKRTP